MNEPRMNEPQMNEAQMNEPLRMPFKPVAPDASGTVSWIHLGDLHMVHAGEQNHQDLSAMVQQINDRFAGNGVSFVYLPGDIADDGSVRAYSAVRECLDRLKLPWCGIVGDHDVHEKSYRNFHDAIDPSLYSAFTVGGVRFFRLNTFSEPRPDSFVIDPEQLDWLEGELQQCGALRPVVLMHCYPSDLKQGGARLTDLLHRYNVRLVDMGHTHYNEISNDGQTLFTATRSTGQIEEGPAGYSVISLDGDAVSWQFTQLSMPALVSITSPADERLLTRSGAHALPVGEPFTLRVRVWSTEVPQSVECDGAGLHLPLRHDGGSLWSALVPADAATAGQHEFTVRAHGADGHVAEDRVRVAIGQAAVTERKRSAIDQENALGEWLDRDLLGTQLGPNKNGKKW